MIAIIITSVMVLLMVMIIVWKKCLSKASLDDTENDHENSKSLKKKPLLDAQLKSEIGVSQDQKIGVITTA